MHPKSNKATSWTAASSSVSRGVVSADQEDLGPSPDLPGPSVSAVAES